MDGKAPDPHRKHIDYHLNQLGIRVFETTCQLISRTHAGWAPIGAPLTLPLDVPAEAAGLKEGNILQETAFHIMQREPESDLRALLQRELDLTAALAPPAAAPTMDSA